MYRYKQKEGWWIEKKPHNNFDIIPGSTFCRSSTIVYFNIWLLSTFYNYFQVFERKRNPRDIISKNNNYSE